MAAKCLTAHWNRAQGHIGGVRCGCLRSRTRPAAGSPLSLGSGLFSPRQPTRALSTVETGPAFRLNIVARHVSSAQRYGPAGSFAFHDVPAPKARTARALEADVHSSASSAAIPAPPSSRMAYSLVCALLCVASAGRWSRGPAMGRTATIPSMWVRLEGPDKARFQHWHRVEALAMGRLATLCGVQVSREPTVDKHGNGPVCVSCHIAYVTRPVHEPMAV